MQRVKFDTKTGLNVNITLGTIRKDRLESIQTRMISVYIYRPDGDEIDKSLYKRGK